jgi:hypothetical protein
MCLVCTEFTYNGNDTALEEDIFANKHRLFHVLAI